MFKIKINKKMKTQVKKEDQDRIKENKNKKTV